MEDAKCILCGHDAKSKVYSSNYSDDKERVDVAPGSCYDCPECGRFCVDYYEENWIMQFATEKQKEKLSEYVKTHQLEDEYLPLDWGTIKKILNLK